MVVAKGKQTMNLLQKLLLDNAKYMKSRKNARKKAIAQETVFTQLYRYAGTRDIFLMIVGTIAAMANGVALPITSLLFGKLTTTFVSQAKYAHHPNYRTMPSTFQGIFRTTVQDPSGNKSLPSDFISESSFLDITTSFGMVYIYIGVFVCILTFIQNSCWEIACCNQIFKLRQIFFAQTMRQDVSWYDEREDEEDLTNKITDDMERMRDGLGSKVPLLFNAIALLFSGLGVGFYTSWKLTLIIMIGGPVLLISSAITAWVSKF